jgi:hypothetical protein
MELFDLKLIRRRECVRVLLPILDPGYLTSLGQSCQGAKQSDPTRLRGLLRHPSPRSLLDFPSSGRTIGYRFEDFLCCALASMLEHVAQVEGVASNPARCILAQEIESILAGRGHRA